MNTNIITTNLRIPEEDLLLARTVAQGIGMSTNEYMNSAIKKATYADYFAIPQKRKSIYDALIELSKTEFKKAVDSFSEEDKAIYDS